MRQHVVSMRQHCEYSLVEREFQVMLPWKRARRFLARDTLLSKLRRLASKAAPLRDFQAMLPVWSQHTSAYVSIRQHTSACDFEAMLSLLRARRCLRREDVCCLEMLHTSAYVRIRPAYVSIRPAYVSIREQRYAVFEASFGERLLSADVC
jgi:hypothetical protein